MPKLAPRYNDRQYYADVYKTLPTVQRQMYSSEINPQPVMPTYKKKKKVPFVSRIIAMIFLSLFALFVLPLSTSRITFSLLHGSQYPDIKTNYYSLRFPTAKYISNDLLFNNQYLTKVQKKKPQMVKLTETYGMGSLENNLRYLMNQYPTIKPAIYVWQYNSENFIDINASKSYSAASIIKLPVLVELFRSVEKGQLVLDETMTLTDYYRAEGSGSLQYKAENSNWSINNLARLMITESDNSATNMIMAKLGSMTDINSAIRQWGLKNTYIQTWLPDMSGNNRTTARDIATILYNIDNNPKFLNSLSREKMLDYMGHVHNNRLIQAGLGPGAMFVHKTGDIGSMLGDAGIVTAPNGTKYIIVILANRPKNSPLGKDFIVKASEIIYNYMTR